VRLRTFVKNHTMKFTLSLLIFIGSLNAIFAQDTVFTKVYSSNVSSYLGKRLLLTPDQGTIQIGTYNQACVVMRTDIDGAISWQKLLSKDTMYTVSFDMNQLIGLTDSVFLVIGTRTGTSNLSHNGAIICMNILGEQLWSQTITNTNMDDLVLHDAAQINDSTLLFVGSDITSTKNIITTLTTSGQLISSYELNNSQEFELNNVVRLSDSTFAIAGSTDLNACFIAKYHLDGTNEWSYSDHLYGVPALIVENDTIYAMTSRGGSTIGYLKITSDGVLLQSAFSWISGATEFDMKMGSNHELLFTSGFDGVYGSLFTGLQLETGAVRGANFIMKLRGTVQKSNKGFYFLGTGPTFGVKNAYFFEHTGLIKTDSLIVSNNLYCLDQLNNLNFMTDAPNLTSLGLQLIVGGATQNDATYLIPVELNVTTGCVDAGGSIEENSINLATIAPNPGNDLVTIQKLSNEPMKLRLYDLNGSLKKEIELTTGTSEIAIKDLQSGTYFYTISNNQDNQQYGKLMVCH
jgi:hypothetical protein